MRKLLVIITIFCSLYTFAQTDLKFGITASSIVDFDFQKIYEYQKANTTINSYYPFKVGADLSLQLSSDFSISTGYCLLYRFMEVNLYTITVGNIFNGYKMFTSEIPLLLKYNGILKKDKFSFFCELGGSLDFMYAQQSVFGGYKERPDYIGVAKWGYFYTMNLSSGITAALQGGFGFQNKIGKNKGILQVGISYHYQIPKSISNEFDYYYADGVGNVTKEDWDFYTRSTYLGLNLKYYFPIIIKLKNADKAKYNYFL